LTARIGNARKHRRQPFVTTHRVDGEPWAFSHASRLPLTFGSACDRKYLATVIMAARAAQVVRTLQFATIGAFLKRSNGQRVVRTAHIALRRRGFSFWNGHFGTCLTTNDKDKRTQSPTVSARYTDSRASCKLGCGVAGCI
jgi:hypothetical protein